MADADGQAPVRKEDGHLVQQFRRQGPEVPHRGGRTQVGLGVPFLGVDEVRKLVRVATKKDRRVVPHHVPVAFLGVELQGKAAHVTLSIGGAQFTRHRRESGDHIGLLADFGKNLGLGVAGDIVGDGEGAVCAPALGMDDALGDPLAVLMGQLLEELVVLHQKRAARTCGQRVLIVGNGGSGRCG